MTSLYDSAAKVVASIVLLSRVRVTIVKLIDLHQRSVIHSFFVVELLSAAGLRDDSGVRKLCP